MRGARRDVRGEEGGGGRDRYYYSGVFSTGATGAIAPVILRKRLIAPVILHLPYSVIIFRE